MSTALEILRTDKEVSRAKIGQIMNVTPVTILLEKRRQYIEQKRRIPTEFRVHPKLLVEICVDLGIPPYFVFGMKPIPDSSMPYDDPLFTYSRIDS